MPSRYEFWLTDDAGRRLMLLNPFMGEGSHAYFSYTRTVNGLAILQMGFPRRAFIQRMNERNIHPIFKPDRRIEVWRSPADEIPLRKENEYLIRSVNLYTRDTDNVDMVRFYCRDPKDLLNRRYIIQAAGTAQTRKEDYLDDMMKAIVREQMLFGSALDADGVSDDSRAFPEGEFLVQQDASLGPIVPYTMADSKVLDILNDLYHVSLQLHAQNPTSQPIYFDVVPYTLSGLIQYILDETGDEILDESGLPLVDESSTVTGSPSGFRFTTWAGLRGLDRTASALVFSYENNNIKNVSYFDDHTEEINTAVVKGFGRGESRPYVEVNDPDAVAASRWNRIETFRDGSQEPDQDNLEYLGYADLEDNGPKQKLDATFLNIPGGPDSPRSLYPLDWDLGDLLPVSYAGMTFDVEVRLVYVSMDETGSESVTGMSDINAGNSVQ